jgi:DNA-binding NtrC family response regulator
MNLPCLLIVDDETGVRQSLKMVFNKGYRLLEAGSADTAISQARQERPHVVLLDILMPKIDGIEILRQIKTFSPQSEVIILTGSNSLQLTKAAMDFGAFDFVGKPFDVVQLRHKVSLALEKSRQSQPT